MLELLRHAPRRARRVVIEEGRRLPVVETAALTAGVPVRRQPRVELDRLAGAGLARGVVAVAGSPILTGVDALLAARSPVARARRVLVALDGVLDPQNLGAVLRAASFFGSGGALWARDRSAPLSPAAVRASAGASERLPVAMVTNLARALAELRDEGYWLVGTVVEGGRSLREVAPDLPEALVLVVGGEETGISRLVRERCDFLVSLSGAEGVASLNVASAAAVSLALLG